MLPVTHIAFCVIMIKINILRRKDGEDGGKMKKRNNNGSLFTACSSSAKTAGAILAPKGMQEMSKSKNQIIQHFTDKVNSNIRNIVEYAITMGNVLISVKEQLPDRSKWLKWLFNEVEISEDMAEGYMKVARIYPDPKSLSPLEMSKAFELISLYIFTQ